MMDLSGVFPALTTPFDGDGSVSLADLKYNLQKYAATDLAGFVVMGSTGESVLLSRSEADSVLQTARETITQGKLLIAGTGAESTAETIDRTKRAAELGYDAALVKTPSYYKPLYKPDVLIAHYRRVADASPIPVLLYSVPLFTGIALEAPEVAALAEHSNIIGIKESSGDVRRLGEMLASVPSSFQILVGSAAVVYPALAIGAHGAILALASALPEKCCAVYRLFCEGKHEKARQLQSFLVRASRLIVSELGIPAVKFAMDQCGYRGGLPRLPIAPLGQEQKKHITELLQTLESASAIAH